MEDVTELRIASALSTTKDTTLAVEETAKELKAKLGQTPNLVLAFVSHHHVPNFEPVAFGLCDALGTDHLLGCTGESIVGGGQELEAESALSVWAACLPQATVERMHLKFEMTPEGGSFSGWSEKLPETWDEDALFLLLGEPFTFPADQLLQRLNEDHPGVRVVGGMASGGTSQGQNRLLFGRRELASGAIAVYLRGAFQVQTVVSQGCRPIGRPFVITKAQNHFILELSGQPPMHQLQALFTELNEKEQALVQQGVHVGRVINEYKETFGRDDFLIRNVIGADPHTGAIAIGDTVRPGQTVQFQIRDADTADEDLRELLVQISPPSSPVGGLLFTCNGRGTRLFDQPHHDAQSIQTAYPQLPLAGFFAQGEIGPVGRSNYLHGFTASVALFSNK